MFSICFDGSSSERGKWFRPLACMAGLQLDTAPAALKNKLTGACLGTFQRMCMCVCVPCMHFSVCTVKYFSHTSNSCSFSAPFLSVSCLFYFPTFFSFVIPTLLLSYSIRQIKISVRWCLEEQGTQSWPLSSNQAQKDSMGTCTGTTICVVMKKIPEAL